MPTYPKRLIEVDLPIKQISAHARREKSIRHGHISTLHIWWARRPLAACRAVICAALWPDPVDDLCPPAFRQAAALVLANFAEQVRGDEKLAGLCAQHWSRWKRTTLASLRADNAAYWPDMRYAMLDFIADFANWNASTVPAFLEAARVLTHVSHLALSDPDWRLPMQVSGEDLAAVVQALKSKIEDLPRPLLVDPFAGGGAIPLEALRVGADAFASDLNPVAVLLNKVVLEYIPKYGQRLADEIRKWGLWIKEQAENDLGEFYPNDPDGSTPIAYLWARTITCEGPNCGADVPLMRSLWLAKKGERSVALRIVVSQTQKRVDFEIIENARPKEVDEGTVRRGAASCPICGFTTQVASVRRQLKARHGGAADARLFCVVTTRPGCQGRFYRLPSPQDLDAFERCTVELAQRQKERIGPVSLTPDEPLPPQGTLGFRVQLYGMEHWGDLYTPRQALTLATLARQITSMSISDNGGESELQAAVQACLSLALGRLSDRCSTLCTWDPSPAASGILHTFSRQALPFVWDFAEGLPFETKSGGWLPTLGWIVLAIESQVHAPHAIVQQANATQHPLPDDAATVFVSDPPYYDAVPYSDLSDYFYVWLKRAMPSWPEFSSSLTPKAGECIVDEIKGQDRAYFERTMAQAMGEARRILSASGIGVIVFAHKSTAGWEAQLQAMIDAGWILTGSWPIDTELGNRLRAMNSAALASSIHLVCRPRSDAEQAQIGIGISRLDIDNIGDWRDVLAELPGRIHEWMPRLASEGVVGADAIFACLGPALEVFSRYARVEKASGEQVTLKEYLEYVWAAVAKEALTMIFEGADASGLEEDARLTAMWLWTLSTAGDGGKANQAPEDDAEDDEEGASKSVKVAAGYYLEFDAARKIAQGLGAHLERLTSLLEIKGDKARLLPVAERATHLFGKDEGQAPARRQTKPAQLSLLATLDEADQASGGWGEKNVPESGKTVLDRVHQSMILFAAGRSEALKRFLVEEKVGTDQRFWRLAQALSALYPAGSDEKRWVDGVLARKKGLGF